MHFGIRSSDATTLEQLCFLAEFAALNSSSETNTEGSLEEMRPVLMACLASGLGLLPAATSPGIGAQPKQPLESILVGGMATTTFAVLFVLAVFFARRRPGTHFTHSGAAAEAEELRVA